MKKSGCVLLFVVLASTTAYADDRPILRADLDGDGFPVISIEGTSGKTYAVYSKVSLDDQFWLTRGVIHADAASSRWKDPVPVTSQQRFYLIAQMYVPQIQMVSNMVWIPPGAFVMGSPPDERNRAGTEGPQTIVRITKGFWLGKYEVTQGEYVALMGTNTSRYRGSLEMPAEYMKWTEAVAYCQKLTVLEREAGRLPTNYEYRLPTEAEWEYACRAGTTTRFSFGDGLECDDGSRPCPLAGQYMWYRGNVSPTTTKPVGQKLPNPWGLYDMHGNAAEWCADVWADSLSGGFVEDPTGPASGTKRVYRGGTAGDELRFCRSASRSMSSETVPVAAVGFRIALAEGPPVVAPTLVRVPAGDFDMGDLFGEGSKYELPVHSVYVSGFYMDDCEISQSFWEEVYRWAIFHGYEFGAAGRGKGRAYPIGMVDWYDALKWCNARSEMEGIVPAYYTDAAQTQVYRKGKVDIRNEWVKWNTGYRLPTEAEWEKAARGGIQKARFPWGDTISHANANYRATETFSYDVSQTKGLHPDYSKVSPPISPVGSFPANGYGLHDMAGNVWEYCWDWYHGTYYASSPAADPRGPSNLYERIARGGSCISPPNECRVSHRYSFPPNWREETLGFRCVLPGD